MKKKGMLFLGMAALLLTETVDLYAGTTPEVSFGGQYRINAYTLNDDDGAGGIAAARVRIRQNIDLKFSEQFNTHIQFNIGHINEGAGNHNLNQNGEASVGLRHAVMNYKFSDAALLQAGLVPIADKFGDTLFSSDWDFSPVAVLVKGNAGVDYRAAWMKIEENDETDETAAGADTDNDMDAYLLDLGKDLGVANVGVMGLVIRTPENGIGVASDGYETNLWLGIRADGSTAGLNWHASLVSSNVDKSVTGAADDSTGLQFLAKVDGKIDKIGWGLLGLYTTGSDDGEDSFFSPQTFYGGQGYWGKTGILNIQGPTDTGMDVNNLRTDNGGLGLTTIQANISAPLMDNLNGYIGAGGYQANEENPAGDDDIGADVYAQVKYKFPDSPLALDAGFDVASLGKAAPNSGGDTRTATAFFARLQAEF
ncbi:MAG: hypothetical protein Q7T53_07810 [Deltaproteobacteria bacterium]|nr:hypothetical protein [Deltaproteobacteria bacterium]